MKVTEFTTEKVVERITRAHKEREDFESFVSYASEEFGGISFVGVALSGRPSAVDTEFATESARFKWGGLRMLLLQIACRLLRIMEFIFLSTFSEHLATRRWNQAETRNVY